MVNMNKKQSFDTILTCLSFSFQFIIFWKCSNTEMLKEWEGEHLHNHHPGSTFFYTCLCAYLFIHRYEWTFLMHFKISYRHHFLSLWNTSACRSSSWVQYLLSVLYYLWLKVQIWRRLFHVLTNACTCIAQIPTTI